MAHNRLNRRLLSTIHRVTGSAHVRMELGGPSRQMSLCPKVPIIRLKDRKTLIAVC